jgi:hypothetical protein
MSAATLQAGADYHASTIPQVSRLQIGGDYIAHGIAAGWIFNVMINSTMFSYTTSGGDDPAAVATALISAINAGAEPVAVALFYSSTNAALIDITADAGNTPFTCEFTASLGGEISVTTSQSYSVT